jgi:hypothetical protein
MSATPWHPALYDANFDVQRSKYEPTHGKQDSLHTYSGLHSENWIHVSIQPDMGTPQLLLPFLLLLFFLLIGPFKKEKASAVVARS